MRTTIFLLFIYFFLGKSNSVAHAACCTHSIPRLPARVLDEKNAGKLTPVGSLQLKTSSDTSIDDDFVANDDNDNEEAPHLHVRRFRPCAREKISYAYSRFTRIVSKVRSHQRAISLDASDQCVLQSVFLI